MKLKTRNHRRNRIAPILAKPPVLDPKPLIRISKGNFKKLGGDESNDLFLIEIRRMLSAGLAVVEALEIQSASLKPVAIPFKKRSAAPKP